MVEWTNILSKIKLRSDNQNKANKTEIKQRETTKENKMSKVFNINMIIKLFKKLLKTVYGIRRLHITSLRSLGGVLVPFNKRFLININC